MWKLLDVQDPSVRAELRSVSWDQPQVTDSSRLVVFCARRGFSPEDVQRYLERIVEVRGVTMESLNLYRDRIVELAGSKSPDVLKAWLERQVYIALEDSPYYTLCALALGYRDEEADKYARLAKVRFDRGDVIQVI